MATPDPTWGYWTESGTASITATNTWGYWNETTTAATTTANTDTAWGYWCQQGTSDVEGNCQVWYSWVSASDGVYNVKQYTKPVQMSAEQAAALAKHAEEEKQRRERALEEMRKRQDEYNARMAAAKERAEVLLLENLTEEQEKAWKQERAIFVTSQSGKRYKIKEGMAHNVFELDETGRPVKELCVHVGAVCPNADNVLAQKLALEHHEDMFVKRANIWDLTKKHRPLIQSSN